MFVVGVDLAGPSNEADTVCCAFETAGSGLRLVDVVEKASDRGLIEVFSELDGRGSVVAGLDAPLSYEPGGGSRESDTALRKEVIQAGLRPGSVMAPTFNRMAYLTLRGVSVARALGLATPDVRLVEVHPGAALALGGAPIEAVREIKRRPAACIELLQWMEKQGLEGVASWGVDSDHYVAACAAALATWKWSCEKSEWVHPADPPLHPFDFAV